MVSMANQVIFSQNFLTVPGTVVLIPQLWCQSDPETAKMLVLATKSSQVNSVCSGGLLSVFFFVPQLIMHNPKCPNLHAVHISGL
jgi:hypothetical protein